MGFRMQWLQLDHMQTICTSLQTDNHTNTSSLSCYRPDALPDTQPTVSKHWMHTVDKLNAVRKRHQRCSLTHTAGLLQQPVQVRRFTCIAGVYSRCVLCACRWRGGVSGVQSTAVVWQYHRQLLHRRLRSVVALREITINCLINFFWLIKNSNII